MARDPAAPFTAQELDTLRNKIFPSLPSYKKEDESVDASHLPEAWKQLKWERSPEIKAAYKAYWDQNFGGRAKADVLVGILAVAHDHGPWMREHMKPCDRNGDGFIQKDEFENYFQIFSLHYPEWEKSYEQFVKEADVNEDGKVSIDEAVAWHEKYAPK